MVFGLFKKKDPVCGMKEENGKGTLKYGEWFCSDACLKDYEKNMKHSTKGHSSHGCC